MLPPLTEAEERESAYHNEKANTVTVVVAVSRASTGVWVGRAVNVPSALVCGGFHCENTAAAVRGLALARGTEMIGVGMSDQKPIRWQAVPPVTCDTTMTAHTVTYEQARAAYRKANEHLLTKGVQG